MHVKACRLIIFAVVLIAAIAFPRRGASAQNNGPQQSPPSQQPEPVKPPTSSAPSGPAQKPQEPPPQVAISVQSNLVTVDAIVTDQDGNLVTGLKRENFRVLDDGQPQQVTNFAPTDAPITVVILMEYSNTYWGYYQGYFGYKAQLWADGFLQALKPQDWVALKTFDLRTTLQEDFTQDKRSIDEAIRTLGFPNFHEAVLFDAVYETLNQLRDVKGKKSILLLATGFDTFSKHNLDQILTRLKESETTIFASEWERKSICIRRAGPTSLMLRRKINSMTFARMTGGYAFFPRFQARCPTSSILSQPTCAASTRSFFRRPLRRTANTTRSRFRC